MSPELQPVSAPVEAPAAPAPEHAAEPIPDGAASDTTSPDVPVEAAPAPEEPKETKQWYVVKVQSGREESIKGAIERRVKIEGLEQYFGQIVIPVEKVTELRKGKRYVKSRKLYPGYLMVQVDYN